MKELATVPTSSKLRKVAEQNRGSLEESGERGGLASRKDFFERNDPERLVFWSAI